MYVETNYQSKKALKKAVSAGVQLGVYQPNNFMNTPRPENGTCAVEGPWYPQAHKWYATVTLKNGFIVSVK
jgi:hypothetical protein